MSDFAQNGPICTLQRLNETHLAELELQLLEIVRHRPIGLVLPCHGRDLEQPAFERMIAELSGAQFLREIVVSVNAVTPTEVALLHERIAKLPAKVTVLQNADITGTDAAFSEGGGKGGNVRAAFEHLATASECEIFAVQDCDVSSFCRLDLARLCLAVAHPQLGFQFAKAYYARATDRLYGRVSRLFLAPLLQALSSQFGRHPLLDFLLSFRYPLAGEIALTRELAAALPARK